MTSTHSSTASATLSNEVAELVHSVVAKYREDQRADRESGFDVDLWDEIVQLGLTRVGVDEESGGSGGSLSDAMAASFEIAAGGCGVPFTEAIVSARLLAEAGLEIPDGILTLALHGSFTASPAPGGRWRITGSCEDVPWASVSDYIVGFAKQDDATLLIVMSTTSTQISKGFNLAGEPFDAISFDSVEPVASIDVTASEVQAHAKPLLALGRSVQIAGAAHRALDLAVEHTSTRNQFGRPIGKFQAVQHHLAVIAEECELSLVAITTALHAVESDSSPELAAAVAKIITGEAATTVAARTHQVHGAIGLTMEYDLQRLTRRMWAWRDEGGTETDWSENVGASVRAEGDSGLWPLLTSIDPVY